MEFGDHSRCWRTVTRYLGSNSISCPQKPGLLFYANLGLAKWLGSCRKLELAPSNSTVELLDLHGLAPTTRKASGSPPQEVGED